MQLDVFTNSMITLSNPLRVILKLINLLSSIRLWWRKSTSTSQKKISDVQETHPQPKRLPVELIQIILNLAAASSRQACLSLCLVSSWGRELALPHILSRVVLFDEKERSRFAESMSQICLSPSRFQNHSFSVHSLLALDPCTTGDVACSDDHIPRIVASCPHLTHLTLTDVDAIALICATTPSLSGPHFIALHPPRADLQLTIFGYNRRAIRATARILANAPDRSPVCMLVTALCFVENVEQPAVEAATVAQSESNHILWCFKFFPRLTRFAMPFTPGSGLNQVFENALARASEDLQLFVLVLHQKGAPDYDEEFGRWFGEIRKRDERIHFVTWERGTFQREWKQESLSGESVWEKSIRQTKEWETRS